MNDLILFCGDTHGKHRHVIDAAAELNPMAVILLGDMQPLRPLHEELEAIADKVWFIHGNHDTDSVQNWENVWDSQLADRNIDGRVVVLPNGMRLAGLGGVFRAAVWNPDLGGEPNFHNRKEHAQFTPRQNRWHNSVTRKHWSSIYPDDFKHLAEQSADILVTHEAPGYHINGFTALDDLARSMSAQLSVHGHQHDSLDSSDRWEKQGFKSFGVGLRGITAIDLAGHSRIIVPEEPDLQHEHRKALRDATAVNKLLV